MSKIGIIPACAGNTRCWTGGSGSGGDHPRVCGEHMIRFQRRSRFLGSSPRVRGTRRRRCSRSAGVGIIPACAGNTAR